jgi:hypothetical protein
MAGAATTHLRYIQKAAMQKNDHCWKRVPSTALGRGRGFRWCCCCCPSRASLNSSRHIVAYMSTSTIRMEQYNGKGGRTVLTQAYNTMLLTRHLVHWHLDREDEEHEWHMPHVDEEDEAANHGDRRLCAHPHLLIPTL